MKGCSCLKRNSRVLTEKDYGPIFILGIQHYHDALPSESDHDIPRRAYITTTVRQRLHQRGFRERVLHAYREQCALCRLRHTELLDAAHIITDREEEGTPQVSNGLSLCKLHHAAFDRFLLGITPDYTIPVGSGSVIPAPSRQNGTYRPDIPLFDQ